MPQYHVQVLETDANGDFAARELLPWADPYIASLMGQLEQNDHGNDDETWDVDYEPVAEAEDDEVERDELPEEDWHLDGEPRFPPVYGGWPLLNDA